MCGRTTLVASELLISRWLRLRVAEWTPRYNLCPGQDLLVLRRGKSGALEVVPLRWGLIPSWATDPRIAFQCINARRETVASKPAFRDAFRDRRCLIIVDGWYEWAPAGGRGRQPHAIRMPGGGPFGFAGLWESWRPPEGGAPIETCTIVTAETCPATAHLHHRMPVVLAAKMSRRWLDPRTADEELFATLRPYDGPLDVFPVSTLVNGAKVDDDRCLARVVLDPDAPAEATRVLDGDEESQGELQF